MKNNTIEAKAKEEKQRDFFTDLENWENSFYCNECGCDEITDFNYDRTVANGEVWYCKEHRHEVITGHKPNEDDNIYLKENPEVKQDEMAEAETGESKPSHLVMNIVNGLYELAGLSPEKRHILNDRADEFVADVLAKEPKGSELNEAIRLLNLLKESYYSPNKHIKQAVSYFLDKHLKK